MLRCWVINMYSLTVRRYTEHKLHALDSHCRTVIACDCRARFLRMVVFMLIRNPGATIAAEQQAHPNESDPINMFNTGWGLHGKKQS